MRRIATAGLAAASLIVGGWAVPAAAAADPCLHGQAVTGSAAPIAASDSDLTVVLRGADCTDGGTVSLVDPTGATSTVPFTSWDPGDANNPEFSIAHSRVPLATGAGTWRIVALHHGGASATLPTPYSVVVTRAYSLVLDAESLVVPAGSRAVVYGTLGRYNARGTVDPAGAGLRVRYFSYPLLDADGGNTSSAALTDASGRFHATLALPVSSLVEVTADTTSYVGDTITVVMQRQVRILSADPEPSQNSPRTIRATAWPAGAPVSLELYHPDTSSWQRIAYGHSDTSGTVSLADNQPFGVGSQRLRVVVYSNDDYPSAVQEFTRVIKYATALDGVTGATSATVIKPGTKMSTYGHLKISRSGVSSGYAGQRVDVQTRPRGTTTAYKTVVSATTTGTTGYYYANWIVRADVDVRVQFLSKDADVKNVWKYIRVVDVR